MSEHVYSVFVFLADAPLATGVRINIWFWLMFATAPTLVFFVSPERPAASHVVRVIFAVGLIYVFLNLSVATSHSFAWADYLVCQENSIHRDMSPEMQIECKHHLENVSGAQNAFALLFGWIPAGIYVGLWEAVWRIWNRRKIIELGHGYKGRIFSNLTMFAPLCLVLFLYFTLTYVWLVAAQCWKLESIFAHCNRTVFGYSDQVNLLRVASK